MYRLSHAFSFELTLPTMNINIYILTEGLLVDAGVVDAGVVVAKENNKL